MLISIIAVAWKWKRVPWLLVFRSSAAQPWVDRVHLGGVHTAPREWWQNYETAKVAKRLQIQICTNVLLQIRLQIQFYTNINLQMRDSHFEKAKSDHIYWQNCLLGIQLDKYLSWARWIVSAYQIEKLCLLKKSGFTCYGRTQFGGLHRAVTWRRGQTRGLGWKWWTGCTPVMLDLGSRVVIGSQFPQTACSWKWVRQRICLGDRQVK